MSEGPKGELRERLLSREVYFSDGYFDLKQIYAQGQQVHEIHKMKPESMIEIGIGNGFTSSFFRKSGIDVVTVDINPNLKPEIVCSIEEMPNILKEKTLTL
jgi:protein-L-isoaspartate O-methyltransferase